MNLYYRLIPVPQGVGPVVLNVTTRKYGVCVRNGDMIGFCNIVAHLRQRENRRDIKIHLEDGTLHKGDFRTQFREFLFSNTDYLSRERGGINLPVYSVWNYRRAAGDYVKITNSHTRRKKICIVPVFDAGYNTFRNWTVEATQIMIDRFSRPQFADHEKMFCGIITPAEINYRDFRISQDFHENLRHIMECEIYVGGDTGTSHFAGALDPGPTDLMYYLNKEKQEVPALPFHYKTKGTLIYY